MTSGLTSETIKRIDEFTISVIGIPSMVLMERAALAFTEKLLENEPAEETDYAVVCGTGNNGGDGLAVGRLLHQAGKEVTLYIVGDPEKSSQEFTQQWTIVKNLKVKTKRNVKEWTPFKEGIIIDALFGIGLNRPVEHPHKQVIDCINKSDGRVIALDIPSGLSADTGEPLGVSVVAEKTCTIGFWKKGFGNKGSGMYTGDISILNIGYPDRRFLEDIIKEEQNNDESI